ncbi:MAG: beta-N-acetylhexosaminidase [Pseudomonadota bacterium]
MVKPIVLPVQGTTLTPYETTIIRKTQPLGFLLFSRNMFAHDKAKKLISELRALVDHCVLVMVDQEGGRVTRFKPPVWQKLPAARLYGTFYEHDPKLGEEFTMLGGQLLAHDMAELGYDVNTVPLLDIDFQSPSDVIGDRAFSRHVDTIIGCAQAMIAGMEKCNILPIIKHIPGHGRALVDSHEKLPIVTTSFVELQESDFVPFRHFRKCAMAMVAHVLYDQIDANHPATLSKTIIYDVIKKTIGFQNLLLSDDLAMSALHGSLTQRAFGALDAGIDVLLLGTTAPGDAEVAALCAALPKADDAVCQQWWALGEMPRTPLTQEQWKQVHTRFSALWTQASHLQDMKTGTA